jgi:hypothetical protein
VRESQASKGGRKPRTPAPFNVEWFSGARRRRRRRRRRRGDGGADERGGKGCGIDGDVKKRESHCASGGARGSRSWVTSRRGKGSEDRHGRPVALGVRCNWWVRGGEVMMGVKEALTPGLIGARTGNLQTGGNGPVLCKPCMETGGGGSQLGGQFDSGLRARETSSVGWSVGFAHPRLHRPAAMAAMAASPSPLPSRRAFSPSAQSSHVRPRIDCLCVLEVTVHVQGPRSGVRAPEPHLTSQRDLQP